MINPMVLISAKPEHEKVFEDLTEVLKRHEKNLTALELLCIMANMVGKIAGLQNKKKMTPAGVMEIIAMNIEEGNRQIVAELMKTSEDDG